MPDTSEKSDSRTPELEDTAALRIGSSYAVVPPDPSQPRAIFRLIHKNHGLGKAWVIQIPVTPRERLHVKAPVALALSTLSQLLEEQKIVFVRLADPPVLMMSDAEIRALYSTRGGRCPMLEYRDERYSIVDKLTGLHSTAEILEKGLTAPWVKEQATRTKKSRAKLYDILHRYWAGNLSKNALLPDYWRSGGKGKERVQKRKLGRPNAAARAAGNASAGYFLSEIDKQRLRLGWRYFLSAGRTRRQAYLETMAAFYCERHDLQDGKQVPILRHPNCRPTLAQFETWGSNGDRRLSASRIQLGEIDWAKKNRGISGSAKDGLMAVGMQAVCDTTTNDAYLKSVVSRIKTVGPVHRLLITESRCELIIGLHCSFEAPSARTFLLAVAHAGSSKVEFCERFGITITDEEWPACVARTYLGDNGEYRNELSREALAQFGASVDNIPSGQPQFNGVAESKHHVIHARLDHTLDGTTNGQPRRRGKSHPAIDACVNYFEYMRELIKEVLYHNNDEPVPHLLNAEMRRARVEPNRISIYRWLISKGYVVGFSADIARLRAHLYPSLPATLTESGVYLLREDRGEKAERIYGARYMGECLVRTGLLEQARRKGNRRITVRANPTDPRSVWIQTPVGLEELTNITSDPILYREAPLADLIAIQDEDKLVELDHRAQDEQIRVAITASRQSMLSHAQEEKKAELASLPKPLTKADHYKDISKNRQDEAARLKAEQHADENRAVGHSQASGHKMRNRRRSEQEGRPPNSQLAELYESDDSTSVNPALDALINYIREPNGP